ncbi:outer membrane protein assembly factor BamB family protein [Acanthopleuribacter pedis]|uniref:PQQ-binding-like beta-propeller repeat protein n=1 Tax=Acanthopleuribacter pedis TaxID=442870 RepID=A0A8J7U6L0_9BACT|nr:PQQ-binding-like beta-propeller repeat protein [Acanthopleuribacter pedis]MBO1321553.1 PQQ-binding-like beta-propeller repeat protein [Acanthopleuribacter pedis]
MVKPAGMFALILMMPCFAWQPGNDWPEAAGPNGTYASSVWDGGGGELSVLWRYPLHSVVSPVVFAGRVYAHGREGDGEVLIALDAFDGRMLWRFHFPGGAVGTPRIRTPEVAPVVDLETGNVTVLSSGRQLFCVSPDGRLLWQRHLAEHFGFSLSVGPHRPTLLRHDRLVICTFSLPASDGKGLERLVVGLDKNNGNLRWLVRDPADARVARAPATLVPLPEAPVLLVGGFADGPRFIQPETGEVMDIGLAERGAIRHFFMCGNKLMVQAKVATGEELRCYDLTRLVPSRPVPADVVSWRRAYVHPPQGWAAEEQVLVVMERDGTLEALEFEGGRIRWRARGLFQQARPFVLTPGGLAGLRGNRLVWRHREPEGLVEAGEVVVALPGPAVDGPAALVPAYHRFYVQSGRTLVALGRADSPRRVQPSLFQPLTGSAPSSLGEPAVLHIEPTRFHWSGRQPVRAFVTDRHGRRLREVQPQWTLDGFAGNVDAQGGLNLDLQNAWFGKLNASWQGLEAQAEVFRQTDQDVLLDLEALAAGSVPHYWTAVQHMAVEHFDGERVFAAVGEGERDVWALFHGFAAESAQVSGLVRAGQRGRRLPEMGLYYRGFFLSLMENGRGLRLSFGRGGDYPGVEAGFLWKQNIWYHLKIEVQREENSVVVRAKAWPQVEREPDHWQLEMTPRMGVPHGTGAGFFGRVYGRSRMLADNLWLRAVNKARY